MRDWVGYLGNQQVKTPHLDRLAERGVAFTRSFCASPCCNPSRTALLSGLRPGTSGVYNNSDDWRQIIPAEITTLPLHFKNHGYHVAGAGKIYHGGAGGFNRLSDWTEYMTKGAEPDSEGGGKGKGKKFQDDVGGVGGIRFGALACSDQEMPDYATVSYCLDQLRKQHDRPFFLACGLVKPHMAWSVPQKYYDLYPLESVQLPKVLETDLDDVPPAGVKMAKPDGDHAEILKSGRWKEAVQAYLATITFCDAMVGRLIDGFDQIGLPGQYDHLSLERPRLASGREAALAEVCALGRGHARPYLWIVPGVTKPGGVCHRTVDYMQIYPTLCDLAGLPTPKHVQGVSIRRLLENPAAAWEQPAVTTWLFNNHAVRTEDWRYIRYADGGEELYHNAVDPLEWTNLAGQPDCASIKADLGQWLPKENASDRQEGGKAQRKAEKQGKNRKAP